MKKSNILKYFIIVFLLFSSNLRAEKFGQERVDSLEYDYHNKQLSDSAKADLCSQIAMEYYNINPDIGVEYAVGGLDIALKGQHVRPSVRCYNALGLCYFQAGEYPEALDAFYKALKINEEIKDRKAIGQSYGNIGLLYFGVNNYGEAEENLLKAIAVGNEFNDTAMIIKNNGNLGNLYLIQQNIDKALDRYNITLELTQKSRDTLKLSYCYLNFGSLYFAKGDFDKALDYYNKSYELNIKLNNKITLLQNYRNYAQYYFQLFVNKQKNDKKFNNSKLAHEYEKLILNNAEKGIKIATELSAYSPLAIIYSNLANFYHLKKDNNKAFEYLVLSVKNNDLANLKAKKDKISQIKSVREREIKNKEMSAIVQESILSKTRMQYLSVIALLSIVILIILFFFFIKKRKDNSKLQTINTELIEKDKQLMIINSTKDKLFNIISHDLKNPISGISNLAEILSDDYHQLIDSERQEYASSLKKSSASVLALLEDLLSWSLTQTRGMEYYPENICINEIIMAELVSLSELAAAKEINIIQELENDYHIFADKEMVAIVLRNLITNAIKFSHNQSEIKITALEIDEKIEICVIDSGLGIAENDIPKLFDSQQKFTSSGTNNEKGTGIGLLLCKELIEMNGGEIRVESALGLGSKFFFSLPILLSD